MSSQTALSKSPNKHNRLFLVAEPLNEELCCDIENGKYGVKMDFKERARIYAEKYDWDVNQARKIWCFGPDGDGANIVVDETQGVQYLNEIKEHINTAFQWATKEGPVCEETMRGIRFNLQDVTLHADSIHRGAGQLIPCARRVYFASQLLAKPTLQEPVFLVDIIAPTDCISGIYQCMAMRRGQVFEEIPREGTPLTHLKAYLPVSESFGFTAALRQATSGQAFPQCVFDHWENITGDINVPDSLANKLVLDIRKRKSLKVEMPAISNYLDKL